MKRVSARAVLLLILAGVLVAGLAVFAVEYFLQADEWVVFSGSPHVYAGGNLASGLVTDRDGQVLLRSSDGERTYNDNAALRTACLHVLGDEEGYVRSAVLNTYTRQMIGYSEIGGLYHLSDSGNTMQLTLSAGVQEAAWEALAGRRGTVGVMNWQTGELLCMVSSPSYDPTDRPEIDEADPAWQGVYVNRFLSGTYVPGSIFKLVTLTAALRTLPDAHQMSFWCGGSIETAGGTVTCTTAHGSQTLSQALTNSCNVAFGTLAIAVGGEALEQTAAGLGLLQTYTLDGLTTAAGQCTATDVADNALAWAGIGQYQDLVNPCSFLTLVAAIAGGGRTVSPYLVEQITTPIGRRIYRAEPETAQAELSADEAAVLAACMRAAASDKYGDASFAGLTVGAKTGTAELGDGTANAMLVGFAFDESCPVAFFIAVEQGGSGAAACLPIASAVLSACREALA